MKITDGSFNGKIYSENIQNFITGGTFSDPTALHYLGEGANVQINLKADYTGETGTLNQKAFEIGANRTVSMNLGTHTFEMTKTGNTSAGNVSIANGELKLSQGLTLTGGTWDMISGSKLTIADGSSLTINGGTFVSDASVLLTADYAAQTGITDAKIVGSSGNLNLRLEKSTYTIDDYNTAKTALLNQNTENASLNFLNATLELGDGQQLVAGAIQDEDGALTLTTGPVVADANESATDAEKANKTIESVPDKYVAVVKNDDKDGTKELLSASSITIKQDVTAKGLQIKEGDGGKVALTIGETSATEQPTVTLVGDSLGSTGVVDASENAVTTTAVVTKDATLNMGLEGNTNDQGLTLSKAEVAGTLNANGGIAGTTSAYAINTLTMNADSKVNVLNSTMDIDTFHADGGTMFVDPAYVNIDTLKGENFATKLLVGKGSVVNIGGTTVADLRTALAESGMTVGPNMTVGNSKSVLVVATPIALGESGKIVVDATVGQDGKLHPIGSTTTTEVNAAVHFGEGSLLVMDASKLNGTAAITGASGTTSQNAVIASGSRLYILNAVKGEMTVLSSFGSITNGTTGAENAQIGWKDNFVNPDRMLSTEVRVEGETGNQSVVVSNTVNTASDVLPGLDEEFNPAMNYAWEHQLNNVNSPYEGLKFLSRAANSDYIPDARMGAATIESAARMAFAAAVPQMTKMASDAATNSVVNRMGFANPENGSKAMNVDGQLVDEKALGLALWIAPLWSNQNGFGMEAGNLDYGYNANLGGVSLGVDYTWANNFRAGLMFNIGGGYAQSSGDLSDTTNSMTFWGLGAYAGWKYENFAVMGDVSYTSTWNSVDQDVDARMGMSDLEADIQASAISAGLRGEYKFETSALDIIPHVGVRYMSINTWGYDVDNNMGTVLEGDGFQQNIWTFPVGVTFSKELEMNSDWYFKPAVDFTVIPAAGDIKAREDVCFTGLNRSIEMETQMMDYFTWQGGVGLEFGNEDMSVGVNYTLQAGQNSTSHGVFGMFRYEF